MDSLFKQTGSVHLDRATVGGGLTYECGLHLWCDVNGECHGYLFQILPAPPAGRGFSSQFANSGKHPAHASDGKSFNSFLAAARRR